jgi:hypothetical protein
MKLDRYIQEEISKRDSHYMTSIVQNGIKLMLLGPTYIGRSNMGSSRQSEFGAAFDRAVSIAIDEQVDAVLQVGTLFGAKNIASDYLNNFEKSLERLEDVGIPCYHVPSERDEKMPETTELEETGLIHPPWWEMSQ